MPAKTPADVDLAQLDLGYLALFVGQRVNELVAEELRARGFVGLRTSYGYVFQHLLGGPRSVTELSRLLGVSQQAASKSVAELAALGYIQGSATTDARVRSVELSARGYAAIRAARAFRRKLTQRIARRHGANATRARRLLALVLVELGGADAVRARRVRSPA